MDDKSQKQYHSYSHNDGAAAGWLFGAIVAAAAIGALWFYGANRMPAAPVNTTVSIEQPVQPAAPGRAEQAPESGTDARPANPEP
jgi:hypothetical protein